MTAKGNDRIFGARLQTLCLIIGYLHLVSSVADITYHLLSVAIVTNGFQCDVNMARVSLSGFLLGMGTTQYQIFSGNLGVSLKGTGARLHGVTSLPFLPPLFAILNLGTHGFYPFPHIISSQYNIYVEYMAVPTVPRCYPGMLHVYLVDVLNFFINVIWLKAVIAYVGALYKRDPEPMGMFIGLSIVKLVVHVLYLGYLPQYYNTLDMETYCFLKILDIVLAVFFLYIVRKYTQMLKAEKMSPKIESPPPYVEYLIGTVEIVKDSKEASEKTDAVVNFGEEKKDLTTSKQEPV